MENIQRVKFPGKYYLGLSVQVYKIYPEMPTECECGPKYIVDQLVNQIHCSPDKCVLSSPANMKRLIDGKPTNT